MSDNTLGLSDIADVASGFLLLAAMYDNPSPTWIWLLVEFLVRWLLEGSPLASPCPGWLAFGFAFFCVLLAFCFALSGMARLRLRMLLGSDLFFVLCCVLPLLFLIYILLVSVAYFAFSSS